MAQDKLPPATGLQGDKDGPTNVGGTPPPQPQKPQPPDPTEKHPVADSKANVDHGPFVPGKTDKQADVKGESRTVPPAKSPSREAVPREDDKGPAASPAGLPRAALRQEGSTIRFDWYPASVRQLVTLHRGKKAFVESIVGRVLSCGTDPGPTCLTFRKVPSGYARTTGNAYRFDRPGRSIERPHRRYRPGDGHGSRRGRPYPGGGRLHRG